jgi:hypothetical protein
MSRLHKEEISTLSQVGMGRLSQLKVVGNEKEGGSGRWHMIGICLAPW